MITRHIHKPGGWEEVGRDYYRHHRSMGYPGMIRIALGPLAVEVLMPYWPL